jgi:predicted nuclease of predicted toxin-antitoxin system
MKVYFDENYSYYVARAFNLFEFNDNEIEVQSTQDALYAGATDEEIVKHVARNKGVLFTKDSDFIKAQLITSLMKSHKIGLIYMKTPKKEVYWNTILILLKAYIDARTNIFSIRRIPYYYEIMPNGKLKRMSL